jgi:hypothetical protein
MTTGGPNLFPVMIKFRTVVKKVMVIVLVLLWLCLMFYETETRRTGVLIMSYTSMLYYCSSRVDFVPGRGAFVRSASASKPDIYPESLKANIVPTTRPTGSNSSSSVAAMASLQTPF